MKKYLILVLIVLLIGSLAVGVMAAKSTIAHLYLYEKVMSGGVWEIIEGGAWGKMEYKSVGSVFDFVFNGKGLEAGEDYSLIYYPDPWPGTGLIVLGSATANNGGNVHIAGSVDTDGNLPFDSDENAHVDTTTYDDGSTGAKIWLVQSDNISGDSLSSWPLMGIFLFEEELINFVKE